MTKKLFTEREIQILSNNPYVKSVSQKVSLIQMNLSVFLLRKMRKENYQERFLKNVVLMLK